MPRILLVEDNDDNWDMLSRRLKRRGYDVARAVDGREAVDMAVNSRPDLILMDVNLPIVDGLEATRLIRASVDRCKGAHHRVERACAHDRSGQGV